MNRTLFNNHSSLPFPPLSGGVRGGKTNNKMSNATQLIHSIPVDPLTGSISVPIYQTSTFVQEAPGVNKGYDYARTNNPTRATLETIIAQLEKGTTGIAFGSGLAALIK